MAEKTSPLNVLIVGGGIGGLTTAIALRRQGHHVQIFEQSHLASEVGAAIIVMPNAGSILKRIGVDVADCGGTLNEQIRYINSAGKQLHVVDVAEAAHRWQAPTRLVHRAHFHEHLKKIAISPDGAGPTAQLHKACRIEKVDADTATIFHSDGSTVQGDVLVGADGVHSITRQSVDPSIHPHKTHHSAFRFLITRKAALEDPTTQELASTLGSMEMWYGSDRKIVMYPCADNTLLNFVCIHPTELSDLVETAGYNTTASKEQVLDIYQDFEPAVKAVISKADSGTIKLWQLSDMEQLPSYVQGRMALIGDAAHPFLPHLAQGGAQAIEDGVALATVLGRGVAKSDVPLRLELYNEARFERASTIQEWTRLAGKDNVKDTEATKAEFSVLDSMEQAISHDEHHHSTQILRKHEWKQGANQHWTQPVAFGPVPNTPPPPPTSQLGKDVSISYGAGQTATITFKTSATLLRNLFPNDAYRFRNRDTVALASFRLHTSSNLLGSDGGNHHMLSLYIHDVVYTKSDDTTIEGTYLPVLIQDVADPTISGLDAMPIVYSDIKTSNDNDRIRVELGWRGTTWGKMEWDSPVNTTEGHSEKPENEVLLLHKYASANGTQNQTAGPAASHAAYLEIDNTSKAESVKRKQTDTGNTSFHFDAHDWKGLPTLHHIASRLAELPIFEAVETSVVENDRMPDFTEMKAID